MSMTESERKQVQAETLVEIIKALGDVAPEVGVVSYAFMKFAERLAKRTEELVQEARRLAPR
jgi:2-phospho-L-lactate guanylyltransferase (CobY/MobA/RfbA family)